MLKKFRSSGTLSLRVKLNKKIHMEGLHTFFSTKYVDLIDADVEPHTAYKEVEWEEVSLSLSLSLSLLLTRARSLSVFFRQSIWI